MKKFIVIAVLVGVMTALLATAAWAAGPATPTAQGYGPGNGMHAWNQVQATQSADCPCGAGAAGSTMGGMMRGGRPAWAGDTTAVEALLGMTSDELHAERLAGKSLAQIAEDKDVTVETLVETIVDAKEAALAQLVADGELSQEQMDLMLAHMRTQVQIMVERTTTGPAFAQGQTPQRMGRGQMQSNGMMGRGGRGANR